MLPIFSASRMITRMQVITVVSQNCLVKLSVSRVYCVELLSSNSVSSRACFMNYDSLSIFSSPFVDITCIFTCLIILLMYRYPPGHGDVFPSLMNSGKLDALLAKVCCS